MTYLYIFFTLLTVTPISATEHEELTNVVFTNHNNIHTLHFKAFGRYRRFLLQPGSVVFTPGFRTLHADGETLKPIKDINVRSDSFYNLNRGKGSVHIERDNDKVLVHGIIDDYMTIKPGPNGKHLIRWTRETKVSSTDYIRPDVSRKQNSKQNRSIKEKSIDCVTLNCPKIRNNKHNKLNKRQADTVPNAVTIEVFIAFDYLNSKRLDFDHDAIVKYLGIFWNSVNQRYSSASKPTISVAISGLITFNSAEDEPFITKNIVSGLHVDANKVLYGFKDWLDQQTDLPTHDLAILQTAINGGTVNSGQWSDTITGLSFIGTSCNANGYNSGLFEDIAPIFTGVLTGAHELAHILNVPHDGDEGATDCPFSDGYIMGSNTFSANKWKFSSCSLKIMNEYITSDNGKCMWNEPQSDPEVPILGDWAVAMAGTLDKQCKLRSGDDSNQFVGAISEDICLKLWCGRKGSGKATTNGGAVDGTPCGIQKVCIGGVCTPNGISSLDEQCQSQVGDDYTAQNKDDPNVCTDLKCANSVKTQSITPEESSSCGNAGACINGECLYQILSLDDQCHRNFDDTYSVHIKNEGEICNQLWCSQDQYSLKSRGGADENSSCGSGKVCRNQQCVDQ